MSIGYINLVFFSKKSAVSYVYSTFYSASITHFEPSDCGVRDSLRYYFPTDSKILSPLSKAFTPGRQDAWVGERKCRSFLRPGSAEERQPFCNRTTSYSFQDWQFSPWRYVIKSCPSELTTYLYYTFIIRLVKTCAKILVFVSYFCYHNAMRSENEEQVNHSWDIVGHTHAITTLQRVLASRRVRHAYLFTGPEHVGKALLARRFAQALLCTGGPDATSFPLNPCHTCLSCRKVLHNNHPDVHYIARPADRQFILIDQVRALQSDSARKTLEGRRNIFLIDGMHEMNLQAANCLLKTLEEPEPDVVLLLTAPDPGLLLPTILSRVQQIPLHLLTTAQIRRALQERWHVADEDAALISSLAAGRIGWAVRAVENEDLLSERLSQLEMLTRVPVLGRVQRFDLAQKLSAEGDKIKSVLELWLLWWRDLVFAANDCSDLVVNVDMRTLLQNQAARISSADSVRMIRNILRTLEVLDQNVNMRMALEVLMLDVPDLRT